MSDQPDTRTEREYRMAQDEIMGDEQRREWEATRDLIAVERPATIVRAAIGDVTDAIREYTRIQAALDKALPDCIQTIQGKQFRKKNYWRAIATAFNLTLEIREEKLDEAADLARAFSRLLLRRALMLLPKEPREVADPAARHATRAERAPRHVLVLPEA